MDKRQRLFCGVALEVEKTSTDAASAPTGGLDLTRMYEITCSGCGRKIQQTGHGLMRRIQGGRSHCEFCSGDWIFPESFDASALQAPAREKEVPFQTHCPGSERVIKLPWQTSSVARCTWCGLGFTLPEDRDGMLRQETGPASS